MNNNQKEDLLKQYQYSKERIAILLERKKVYENDVYSLKSPSLSGMPHSTDIHGLDDKVITAEKMTAEIDTEIALMYKRMNFIKDLIQRVSNTKYRSMLEMRFIDGIQNKQVMNIMDRSFQAVQSCRRKAIAAIEITDQTVKDFYSIK